MEIIVLVCLILANGAFAMSELAVVSSRHVRLQQLADRGAAGAAAAIALAANPGRFLSTVQVGITLIGILMGAFGGATLSAGLAGWLRSQPARAPYAEELSIGIVVVAIAYFSLVLGELVPKRLALHAPEAIAARVARPMQWLSAAMLPFVKLLTISTEGVLRLLGVPERVKQTVTEAEIDGLMKIGAEAGVFERAEREFVARVLRLDAQTVGAIMTPRAENLRIVRREGYTRLPACRGSLSEVVGILDTLDLLDPALADKPLELHAHLRPPLWVPDTIHVIRLLELFKQHKEHLALVVDEYGELQGLVTLTDVLEAIVGEVPEAGEGESPEIVRRDDGSLLVDGGASLSSLREAIERSLELPADEANTYQTVGGLVMARLGRVPRAGDRFDFAGLRFEVLDMDRRRVDKVMVSRPPRAPAL